ncbi:MAG TPA: ATP-binding cassette domain-containing protein [Candidatus Dormibacteraeota bacterium]
MPPLLSLERCDVSFGRVRALSGVSLELSDGEIVGVVGALGAGKTTLMRLIAGLVRPNAGAVRFDGASISRLPWDARARRGIVHVPAGGGFFPSLTVGENLMLAEPRSAGGARRERLGQLFPLLQARHRQGAASLSGGEQRQLAIARGVFAEPRLLLLDEPLLGLSPVTARAVITLLGELRDQGVAVLVAAERPTEDLRSLDGRLIGLRAGHQVPAEEVSAPAVTQGAGGGDLDRVEVEMVGLPLSTRDRRALQTLAQARGIPVGKLIAELAEQHASAHREEWQ